MEATLGFGSKRLQADIILGFGKSSFALQACVNCARIGRVPSRPSNILSIRRSFTENVSEDHAAPVGTVELL
jgi:hypothetical protein